MLLLQLITSAVQQVKRGGAPITTNLPSAAPQKLVLKPSGKAFCGRVLATSEKTDKLRKLPHCHMTSSKATQLLSCPASKRKAAASTY